MVKEVENDFELSDVYKLPSDSKTQNEITQMNDVFLHSQVTAFENLDHSDEISQYIYALTGLLDNHRSELRHELSSLV